MDNASKALIMAGAILIAVAIVGIGIYIFSTANELTDGAIHDMESTQVSMANNKYYSIAGQDETISGSRALQLYDLALNSRGNVSITGSKDDIKSNLSYTIHYDTDNGTGAIYKVTVSGGNNGNTQN